MKIRRCQPSRTQEMLQDEGNGAGIIDGVVSAKRDAVELSLGEQKTSSVATLRPYF
jgi:hypothetical protein